MKCLALLFSLLLTNASCKTDDNGNTTTQEDNQKVYHNGKIYTVNTSQPWAEAMIVQGNTITFIGSNIDAEAEANEHAEYIDLENAVVLPGFHDVHVHPLEASSENFLFTLNEMETDAENYTNDITNALSENPDAEWLLGWGHSLNTILDADRPPIEILDEISTTRPIVIMEQTSHSIWVNSKALELAVIDEDTPNPVGGIYMKETDGNLNGILIDNAGNEILDVILAPTEQTLENDYQGLKNYGLVELRKYGITSVCDARTYWKRNHHQVWQRLEDEGHLTVRANLGLWAYPGEDDASQIATLQSLYRNEANSLLKINQVKLYNDGIVHNTTSAMENDYLVDYFGASTNNGLNYFAENRIANYIAQLEPMGFDFHIHAIGNRGIRESLSAIEQSGTPNGRHRITHVEFVNESDLTRFAQLNITADCQVAGDFTNPEFWSENDELIGSENTQNVVPIKSLTEANARLTLSSDWDVSSLNPFIGIQNAVSRAPENISLENAIKAYTLNSAYVMRQENRVGSLEVGKLADFIVIDRNIFEIPISQIGLTKVDMTVFDGEVIFERN
ncbi:amidohydrolase [Winogradskyella luteola]|uniref:Amidohydrolase n=1 Tax=Winogradskyella luteola TaxID=2828330 RepID=A0A9X1JN82_9FLAO|nr:amidohydrolase [Winogradskyella luteola]MBV7269290.1 amidohydrolase [Winogradskyella luteola]